MPILVKNPKTDEVIEIDIDETIQTDLHGGDTPETYTKRRAKEKGYTVLAEIVDPKSGESHLIDEGMLGQAEKKGYLYKPVYEAKQAQKQKEPVSKLEALGYGAAKFGTFGAAPAVGGLSEMLKGGSYEKGRKAYEERQNQAWKEHPGYYGTGAAATIVPGLFAKGASLAAGTALGAASPLVEQATKEPTVEGWKQAGKEAVIGGLTSLGLGKLGQYVGPKLQRGFQNISERRATKAVGADVLAPQRRIEQQPGGMQVFGRDLMNYGIVQGTKTVPQMKEKAVALKELSGKAIGKTIDNFDKQIGKPVVNNDELLSVMKETTNKLRENPATVHLAKKVDSMFLNEFEAWSNALKESGVTESPLKKIWEIRSAFDDLAWTPSGIDRTFDKALRPIRRKIEQTIETAALKNGIQPEQLAEYAKNKRMYQVAKEAVDTSTQKINRMRSNRQFSLTDYLSGGAGATAGSTVAGPLGGVIGASLTMLGNKLARERGPQVAAVTLKRLSDMMKNDPNKFSSIMSEFIKTGQIADFKEEQ